MVRSPALHAYCAAADRMFGTVVYLIVISKLVVWRLLYSNADFPFFLVHYLELYI